MNQLNSDKYTYKDTLHNEVDSMNPKVHEIFTMCNVLTWLSDIKLFLLLSIILTWSSRLDATIYLINDFESSTCNTSIIDTNVDNVFWDTAPGSPITNVKCYIAAKDGTKYAEWQLPASTSYIGSELYGRNNVDLNIPISFGTTYYLAGFFRFQRVNNADIWDDTGPAYQFDKLLEFRGNGFRWGIGAGWNGWYPNATDHKFTFDAWYATSVLGDYGPDHLVANVSPYSSTNPLLSDYEMWHGVVLGVTAANSNSGRVQLWVNGVKVIDKPHYTASSGATITQAIVTGTIGQPAYNSPTHYRQMDRILITNDWQDIVNGGYATSPGISLQAPNNLQIVVQPPNN